MKCKNCGSPIDNNYSYCAKCGAKNNAQLGKWAAMPFILIIIVCSLPTITLLLQYVSNYNRNLQMVLDDSSIIGTNIETVTEVFYESLRQWSIYTMLPNLVGAFVLIGCVCCKLLNLKTLCFKDVLVVYLLGLLSENIIGMMHPLATNIDAAQALTIFSAIKIRTTLPALWRWIMIIVFMFVRCGRIRTSKGVLAGASIALLGWSVYLLIINHSMISSYSNNNSLLTYLEHLSSTYYLTIWLVRMVQIYIYILVGQRRIKTGLLLFCIALVYVLPLILQPILLNSLGIAVGNSANTISYVVVGAIGISLDIRCRKKIRAAA